MHRAHEYVSPDIQFRSSQTPEFSGIESLKEMVAGLRVAFPDSQYHIDQVVAEGDAVVHRWTFRGTHRGEFLDVADTGKPVEVTGTAVSRIQDGKLNRHLADVDMLSILQQIGAACPFASGLEGC